MSLSKQEPPGADLMTQVRDALNRYDGKQAIALLETGGQHGSSAAELACLIEAQALMQDIASAEATYERARELHPRSPLIAEAAGLSAIRARHYELAVERFSAALDLDPGYITAYNNLGMAYEYLKRESDACVAYARAIEHNPALAPAYINLGRIAESHGHLDHARTLYEQGHDRTPAAGEFARLLAGIGRNYADPSAHPAADGSAPEHFLATEIGLAVQAHLPPDHKPAMLDLICGPGTVGAILARNAGLMIGVDPRVPLLQAAQGLNIYFDLKQQYPTDYLRTCKRGATDLITSNCGFSNVGDLLQLFLDFYVVLSPGGLLVMTFPTQVDLLGYCIEGGGAFSHDPRYVLARADFENLALKERRDYAPDTHPQVDRTYTLLAFAKPE